MVPFGPALDAHRLAFLPDRHHPHSPPRNATDPILLHLFLHSHLVRPDAPSLCRRFHSHLEIVEENSAGNWI